MIIYDIKLYNFFACLVYLLKHYFVGGVCWASSSSGRCREMLKPNVSKTQCCSNGLYSISWSPESPTGQLLFQWMVTGGPNTCTPCHSELILNSVNLSFCNILISKY